MARAGSCVLGVRVPDQTSAHPLHYGRRVGKTGHTYTPWLVSVSGGRGEGGAPSPPPPLRYYRSNSTAFRHGRDAWFFFFFFFPLLFLFDSEGGRGESRRAVYGCESARGQGRGEGRAGRVVFVPSWDDTLRGLASRSRIYTCTWMCMLNVCM